MYRINVIMSYISHAAVCCRCLLSLMMTTVNDLLASRRQSTRSLESWTLILDVSCRSPRQFDVELSTRWPVTTTTGSKVVSSTRQMLLDRDSSGPNYWTSSTASLPPGWYRPVVQSCLSSSAPWPGLIWWGLTLSSCLESSVPGLLQLLGLHHCHHHHHHRVMSGLQYQAGFWICKGWKRLKVIQGC